jgi:hypothetical protein
MAADRAWKTVVVVIHSPAAECPRILPVATQLLTSVQFPA